ncbi:cell wall-binding repeat-containing protein [Ornithinimicrobium faecis]|uniref:Cell wall-binding repeat-containing protein n=1 Tax=Ornithinimicrobium faecis TaxID=2934158 RepID=A0ABY4YUR1_9MICO|nr:cell wall-binding repeat-containing protein [Ornithinimicrobium sp. HY1793]USQ80205.1 cell wall-binding repeat-containing protein [Ornithinimicrobium sp. HY1793]
MTLSHRRWRRGPLAAIAAASLVASGAAMSTTAAQADPEDGTQSDSPVAAPAADEAERISGDDRYATAAAVAAEYPDGADVVYVASGENYADALSARDEAGAEAGPAPSGDNLWNEGQDGGNAAPVLLTKVDHVPAATKAALEDLAPSQIIVVGGADVVSEATYEELGATERLDGDNRYETAAAIAERWPEGTPTVFLASGENYPDALSGGAVATRANAPILLTRSDHLPAATKAALEALKPSSVVILGQQIAVDGDVEAAVAEVVEDTRRVGGANRYETARLLAERYEKDVDRAFLATGTEFPDALTGSSLAGFEGAPLVLSRAGSLPQASAAALNTVSPQGVALLGGPQAVSPAAENQINKSLPAWANTLNVQMLSFNDYHGHLEAEEDQTLSEEHDPDQHVVGGVEFLSAKLNELRVGSADDQSLTVAAGDLIGGSTFLSGLFHDEPAVESLNVLDLDVSSVGNHEFDEGVTELQRIVNGGCHDDGCYDVEYLDGGENNEFAGTDYDYLAANVVNKSDGENVEHLPGTTIREIDGVQVGFIGMTLEATPSLVSPGGIQDVNFLDEVETANAEAAALQAEGVESIVVLLHEGGENTGNYNECVGVSNPIMEINKGLDASIDAVVTGHTHQPYVCTVADPDGAPRLLTSAAQYGGVVTASNLPIDRTTGDVIREGLAAANHLVVREDLVPDAAETAILDKWAELADDQAGQHVGSVSEPITGDSNTDRDKVTPMANLIADSILAGTSAEADGGAEIAFMNVGGVRSEFLMAPKYDEAEGEITYAEAYDVAPFGNLLVSIDMTGAQIDAVLEQQTQPEGSSRPILALGVSEGFSYTWDGDAPAGEQASNLTLNGVPLEMDPESDVTYRVATLSFLQEGGDNFTAFTDGTNLQGGPEDLANLVDYLGDNEGLTAPECRVEGLCWEGAYPPAE